MKKSNLLFFIIVFIISILIILTSAYLGRYNTIFGDDLCWLYTRDSRLTDCLSFDFLSHGGGYLCTILNQLLTFRLPIFLGINPEDFIGIPSCTIKGIFTVFLLLTVSGFAVFYNKSKLLFSFFYYLSFLYFYYFSFKLYFEIIHSAHNYHRYVVTALLYSILCFYLYKNLFQEGKRKNFLSIFLIIILTFLAVTNLETGIYSVLLFLIFIILNNIFFKLLSFFNKHIKENLNNSYLFNLNLNFYIILLTAFITFYKYAHSNRYASVFYGRIDENLINVFINNFVEFSKRYFTIYFLNISLFWIITFILIIFCFIYAIKNKEIKKVLFPIYLLIINELVIYMLIFCGKTYYIQGQYWLEHGNIQFYHNIILLIPFFIFIDYLYINLKNTYKDKIDKKIFYIIRAIIFTVIVLSASYISVRKYISMINITYMQKDLKQYCYVITKIFRYNVLNNKTNILLPKYSHEELVLLSNDKQTEKFYKEVYYPSVYKEDFNNETKYYFVEREKALKEYYDSGGKFTDEELNNLKFSRLSDKNNIKF